MPSQNLDRRCTISSSSRRARCRPSKSSRPRARLSVEVLGSRESKQSEDASCRSLSVIRSFGVHGASSMGSSSSNIAPVQGIRGSIPCGLCMRLLYVVLGLDVTGRGQGSSLNQHRELESRQLEGTICQFRTLVARRPVSVRWRGRSAKGRVHRL